MVKLYDRLAAALLFLMLGAASTLAHEQAGAGDIQVFSQCPEDVYLSPGRSGGQKGGAGRCGRFDRTSKTALGNLQLMVSRVGVSPAHFVTLTVYGADNSLREVLEKSAREAFGVGGPESAFAEAKNLRPPVANESRQVAGRDSEGSKNAGIRSLGEQGALSD